MDKTVYTALGLMSGTSLDGVDVAVIETDGVDIFGFGAVAERPFPDAEKTILNSVTQDALSWRFSGPPPNSFAQGEDVIDKAHIAAIGDLSADIIGYHGQTVLHHPPSDDEHGQTLQLGRGQVLADKLGLPVAYDFRSTDVAAGGQGAPLSPIYHEALVRYSKLKGRIAVLNLGGVANVTAIINGKLAWATDCGPANGPLDSWVQRHNAGEYDDFGKYAFSGNANHPKVNQWLESDFFKRPVPRSADRYDFDVVHQMANMSLEDGAATLASFAAQAVARDVSNFKADRVIVCGGGRKNPAIMGMLDIHIDAKVVTAEDVGWDGDMLEAQAFAYLAVRTLKGLPISFPETTGCPKPMTGGRVVYADESVFGVIYGTGSAEFAEPDWAEIELKLRASIVDSDVAFAMSYPEDKVPDMVNLDALRTLYLPLYPNYVRELVAVAEKDWAEKHGDKSPEQVCRDLLG